MRDFKHTVQRMCRDAGGRTAGAAVFLFVIGVAFLAERASGQDNVPQEEASPPQQSEPPQSDVEEARSREQRVLRQVIVHSRQLQATLERAEATLRAGEVVLGLELLQQTFDQPSDQFIWLERDRRLHSARDRAGLILSLAEPKVRSLYESVYGGEARRLLDFGRADGDALEVGEVARRYFHTEAGFDAMDWLATRWLDRGEHFLALRAWESLIGDEQHRQRITDAIRGKAAAARLLAGKDVNSSEPHAAVPLRTAAVSAGDASDPLDESKPDLPGSGGVRPAHHNVMGAHRAAARSSIPHMTSAWRMTLTDDNSTDVGRIVDHWARQQLRNDSRAVLVHTPVVAGSAVAFRTYDGIAAVDATSGRKLWTYGATTSLSRSAADAERLYAGTADTSSRTTALGTMMGAYASNSVLTTLTSDGSRVYAVDSMELRPRNSSVPSPDEVADPHAFDRMPRDVNQLIALDLFSPRTGVGGSTKPVWSVGGFAGATQWFFRMDANDDGHVTRGEFLGAPDDFQKLDRNRDGVIDKSEGLHPSQGSLDRGPLSGHFFLGPPLPLDGRLYAITESEGQLNLVALHAATGRFLWAQGIGYVERSVGEDSVRSSLACTPVYAGGIIVCPTQVGVLVGVDALDGSLLWTYYYGDEDVAQPNGDWSFVAHRSLGNAGFRSAPLVVGTRIIVRPRQSEWIHCIDAVTGRGLWKTARNDCEYVACGARGVVMAVGDRLCRGLSIATGRECWSARLGEAAGCGLCIGDEYLLPLADNQIAAIEIATGKRRGAALLEGSLLEGSGLDASTAVVQVAHSASGGADSEEADDSSAAPFSGQLGNLAVAGSLVLSLGPHEIVAYPRADVLLDDVKQRLAVPQRATDDLLLAAELELTLGNVAVSRFYLSQVSTNELPERLRQKCEGLMRAVLYRELADEGDDHDHSLQALDRLSQTPHQRGRFLQLKSLTEVRRGDLQSALNASSAYASLGLADLLPSPSDATHLVSSRSWLTSIDDRIRQRFDEASLNRVRTHVDLEQHAALRSENCEALERFLAVYASWPQADAVRTRLAALLAARGELQRAELLLIQNRHSRSPATAATATQSLARLWDRSGLSEEAAGLIVAAGSPMSDRDDDGIGPPARPLGSAAALDDFGVGAMTRLAYHELQEAQKPVAHVGISQSLWEHCDEELADTYINASRPFVTRATSPFHMIDKGSSIHSDICIIDRLSGTVVGNLTVPSPYAGSTLVTTSQVGHFVPLGSRGSMHGVSLLEPDRRQPLWTASPPQIVHDPDQTQVGPTGPTFCIFQSRRHLFAVDPGTGRLLWQRTDLDPQSGLAGDPVRGIFGDDAILIVVGADHSFTQYRTATGEEMRRGQLDKDARHTQERRTFGRCLLYFAGEGEDRRIRIWDPLADRLVYDRPAPGRFLWKENFGEDEVMTIGPDRILQVVDGRTGTIRAEATLESADVQEASQLAVFKDASRYYINVQPSQLAAEPRRYSYCLGTDTVLPRADMRGDVWAIDRESGKLLWKRTFPPRTVLRSPLVRLPVLVMLSLVGDRANGNYHALAVEVVDGASGETIGIADNQLPDRILHLTAQGEARRVKLWGRRSTITLDFADRTPGVITTP
jgi:outer membrane protein assembly factor BamB